MTDNKYILRDEYGVFYVDKSEIDASWIENKKMVSMSDEVLCFVNNSMVLMSIIKSFTEEENIMRINTFYSNTIGTIIKMRDKDKNRIQNKFDEARELMVENISKANAL
jgi:hypothetical protein